VVPDRPSSGLARGAALFDPETALTDGWEHVTLKGETEYRLAVMNGRIAFRAIGRGSASMIARRVQFNPHQCPVLEWTWCVTRLQATANLQEKSLEDVAASVFVLFGDPGFLFDPKPVPTLRYVWTNDRHPPGAVIDNPYLPGVVRSVVVRRGLVPGDAWVTEKRNLVEDFRAAFGRPAPGGIHVVALFTDNDQTAEPVEAYYGAGRIVCSD